MHSENVVIIGAGLSGLAISKSLIESKTPHILIGAKPSSLPKLGESINPEGTLELVNQFKEFKKHFFTKNLTLIAVGENLIHCNLSQLGRQRFLRPIFKFIAPNYNIPKDMIHVDRSKLDLDIFNSIIQSPYLTYLDDSVSDIEYDETQDKICSLTLQSGIKITISRVFDATNHLRLIGKATNQKMTTLSELQEITYCHYYCDEFDSENLCDWQHSTNLLRLTKDVDGVDGFAWCIPLSDYLSCGISINAKKAEEAGYSSEEIMELVEAAYKRRGLDFRSIYKRAGDNVRLKNQYFKYDRAYGENWMLVGPAYCQVWYMSGSGVATSMAASYIAVDFIADPKRTGKRYQKTLDDYIKTHKTIDWFVYTNVNNLEEDYFRKMTNKWLMSNISRMLAYPQLRKTLLARLGSKFASLLIKLKIISARTLFLQKKCPANHIEQKIDMWRKSSLTVSQKQQQREKTIEHLLSVISQNSSINDVDSIMYKDVRLMMDSKLFIGRWFWKTYVRYIQSHEEFTNLTLEATSFKHCSDKIDIKAKWSAVKNKNQEYSNDVIGTCHFKDEKLIKIESKASNYTFIFGEGFTNDFTLLKVMFSILNWYFFKIRLKQLQTHLYSVRSKK